MDENQNTIRTGAVRKRGGTFIVLILLLVVSTGTSWAIGVHDNDYDARIVSQYSLLQSSSSVADVCLPLLKTIRHTPRTFATERNQRSAGSAAAVGLLVGARFALSPTVKVQANDHDRYALSVREYRQCVKQKALAY